MQIAAAKSALGAGNGLLHNGREQMSVVQMVAAVRDFILADRQPVEIHKTTAAPGGGGFECAVETSHHIEVGRHLLIGQGELAGPRPVGRQNATKIYVESQFVANRGTKIDKTSTVRPMISARSPSRLRCSG